MPQNTPGIMPSTVVKVCDTVVDPTNGNNGASAATNTTDDDDDNNSIKEAEEEATANERIVQLRFAATLLRHHLPIQDRTYKLQLYPACFIGSEAVDLLIKNGIVASRSEAVDALQTLMTSSGWDGFNEVINDVEGEGTAVLFEHVTASKRGGLFEDDYQFYHFINQDDGDHLNEGSDQQAVIIGEGGSNNSNNEETASSEKAEENNLPIMDKYGFLIDDKKRFKEMESSSSSNPNQQSEEGINDDDDDEVGEEIMMEPVEKWQELLDKASATTSKGGKTLPSKLHDKIKLYTRKGLPDPIRQRAWTIFTGVDKIMAQSPAEYTMLLKQADFEWNRWNRRPSMSSIGEMSQLTNHDNDSQLAEYKNKRPCHTVLEQIERDICRTFPNHYLFQTVKEDEEEEVVGGRGGGGESGGGKGLEVTVEENKPSGSNSEDGGGENNSVADDIKRELSSMVEKMSCGTSSTTLTNVDGISVAKIGGGSDTKDASSAAAASATEDVDSNSTITPSSSKLSERGDGQGALRRVLRAYSQYDSDVGYCQGMNFIVAMFLTFLSEEESFWLLVIVMNEEPYMLRALFGEDMSGTHEILFIADKLMKQFMPKLWKHMEREGIHNSMFVTQWLLTLYTSSFPFDLVSRVWDSFLVEGWKVIYRVMLGLLKHAEPTLLEMPFEDILMFFRDYPTMINGQTIMRGSLQIGLKRSHVQKYVNVWRLANPTETGPTRTVISRKDSQSSWTNDSNSETNEPSKKVKSGSKFPVKINFRKKVEKDVIIEDLAPKLLPIVGSTKFAVLIHNALTPAECKQMIDRAEKGGFEDASVYDRRSNRIHRNCKRWYEDDTTLADDWYERILKALDDSALEYKVRNAPWMGTRYNALPIRSVGLNERLRVLKYNQGEYFGSHCDSKFVRGPNFGDRAGETSHVSVQVYLNEKFKGGQTRFHGSGRHYDVKPKTGSILIFDHNLLHQGVVIKAGKKYVVRTDVMYRTMRTRGDEMSISGFPEVIGLGLRQAL